MRYLLGPLVISVLSFSCGSSNDDDDDVTPLVTEPIELRLEFEDFGPSVSSDGSKAVYISQRDGKVPKAYLFDASLDSVKQVKVSERLTGLATETERNAAITPNGAFVALAGQSAGTSQIIVGQLGASLVNTSDLPAGSTVRDLRFDPSSKILAAEVQKDLTASVELYLFTGDATALTFASTVSLPNEEKPRFVTVGAQLQLVTVATGTGSKAVNTRIFDSTSQTFSAPTSSVSLSLIQAEGPLFSNAAGLFSAEILGTPRSKTKLGSAPGESPILVAEAAKQSDIFANALSYDFSSANYLKAEPVDLSGIHGSEDGAYLLLSGLDAHYCARVSFKLQALNLIRRSDMKTLGLVVARPTGEKVWNQIVTDPCALIDPDATRVTHEFDGALQNPQLISVQGDSFIILVESTASVDRELRLLRFTADWTAGTVSAAEIVELSANPRT